MEPARVRVARCRDNAEAMMIRSLCEAHEIEVVISGEHHASMMGGLAGPALSLDVWVDREDAEQAAALIAQMRDGDDVAEPDAEDDDEDDGPHWGIELRRRTAIVLLLSFVITFGAGHLYARHPLRAVILAAIEILGFFQVSRGNPHTGAALIALAVLIDAVGGIRLVRRAVAEAQLPSARVH